MISIPMVNGRAWTWEHEGFEYQALTLDGTDTVRLYYRKSGPDGEWYFGHSRFIPLGTTSEATARGMFDTTTNPDTDPEDAKC